MDVVNFQPPIAVVGSGVALDVDRRPYEIGEGPVETGEVRHGDAAYAAQEEAVLAAFLAAVIADVVQFNAMIFVAVGGVVQNEDVGGEVKVIGLDPVVPIAP